LGSNSSYTLTGAGTINQAKPVIGDLTCATLLSTVLYNGVPQAFPVTKETSGIGDITVRYNGQIEVPTNADTYTITVDIGASTNYETATLSLGNYTIDPREITVNGGQVMEKDYDGTEAATVEYLTFDGLQNSETLALTDDYTFISAVFAGANVGDNKMVTVTSVTLKNSAKATNYTLTNGASYIRKAPSTKGASP
jgi:hypothetical protein